MVLVYLPIFPHYIARCATCFCTALFGANHTSASGVALCDAVAGAGAGGFVQAQRHLEIRNRVRENVLRKFHDGPAWVLRTPSHKLLEELRFGSRVVRPRQTFGLDEGRHVVKVVQNGVEGREGSVLQPTLHRRREARHLLRVLEGSG